MLKQKEHLESNCPKPLVVGRKVICQNLNQIISGRVGSKTGHLTQCHLALLPRFMLRLSLGGIEVKWRASLVAQWLRICLPMQGTRAQALVWEDPTCRGATGPMSHNY